MFSMKGKLSPRYVRPYKILGCVGKVAYELDLPNDLSSWIRFSMSLFIRSVLEISHL